MPAVGEGGAETERGPKEVNRKKNKHAEQVHKMKIYQATTNQTIQNALSSVLFIIRRDLKGSSSGAYRRTYSCRMNTT